MWHLVNVNVFRVILQKSSSSNCIFISSLNYKQITQQNQAQWFFSTEQKLPKICNNNIIHSNDSTTFMQLKQPLSLTLNAHTNAKRNLLTANSIVRQAIANFFIFIEEISHMDEVRKAQNRVITIKVIINQILVPLHV